MKNKCITFAIILIFIAIIIIFSSSIFASYSLGDSYEIDSTNYYITKVEPYTTIGKFKEKLKNVELIERNKSDITDELDELICTGDRVTIKDEVYTVIVYGDLDLDGKYGYVDFLMLKRKIYGGALTGGLNGEYAYGGNFKKYELSDFEIKAIAAVCQQEQGSAQGAAAEASLMANILETQSWYSNKYGDDIYSFVKYSGWFYKAKKYMDSHRTLGGETVRSDVIRAVEMVLVGGKRTVPGYVDEHDCLSDIRSATNNGKRINKDDINQYEPFVTVIKNRYGSTYTFYTQPGPGTDPFGYTNEENRQLIGDAYYEYNESGDWPLINGGDIEVDENGKMSAMSNGLWIGDSILENMDSINKISTTCSSTVWSKVGAIATDLLKLHENDIENFEGTPNYIYIVLGNNYEDGPSVMMADSQYKKLIQTLRNKFGENVPIYCQSAVPASRSSKSYGEKYVSTMKKNNEALKEYCQNEKNIYYVNVLNGYTDSEGYTLNDCAGGDGLHPSSKGSKILFQNVQKAIMK